MNQKPVPLLQTFAADTECDSKHLDSVEANSDNIQTKQKKSDSVDPNSSEIGSEHCKDKDKDTDRIVKSVKENNSQNVGKENRDCDKRYLQCPAAVSMKHLQKFIRMKFGLTGDHRVTIFKFSNKKFFNLKN